MKRLIQSAVDEPFVAFAVLGGFLFIAYGLIGRREERETIEIRPSTLQALEKTQVDLLGRELSDDERQTLVEGYIDDEVLMREAFRQGLEKKDSRVRKRLLDVMRSSFDQPVAAPSRAELEAYFRENRSRFEFDAVVTFDHVFFGLGTENELADPASVLAELRAGADHTTMGDYAMLGSVQRDRTQDQVRRVFGGVVAQQVFSLDLDEWQGPYESPAGQHFVRVTDRRAPESPEFEQLEEYLRQDWMFQRRRAAQQEKINELRQQYEIVLTEGAEEER